MGHQMQKFQAYLVGALLVFGSALWASLFAQSVNTVILLIAIPSIIAGYVYATSLPQYVWGMLFGLCLYMAFEFQLYGPVYKVTGIVYGVSFFIGLGCAILGYTLFRKKTQWQQDPR